MNKEELFRERVEDLADSDYNYDEICDIITKEFEDADIEAIRLALILRF